MATIPTTPKELIAALQSGVEFDDARWTQFDTLYRPVIRLFLVQKYGSLLGGFIDDIVQDAMLNIISAFRKRLYDPSKGHFRRYLATITCNTAVSQLKKLKPNRTQSLETINYESIADPKSDRVIATIERQFHEAVYQRMTKLYFTSFAHDPTDRDVWDAYQRGESSAVTAQRLGKTADAVRQQRKRILATLKSLAEE